MMMMMMIFTNCKCNKLASLIPRYVPTQALCFIIVNMCSPRKTTMATLKSFSTVASNIWNALQNHLSSIPTLPALRRALKHHLFLLAYPDSSAKSGKIKPAQCITLCDTNVSHFVIQHQLLPLHSPVIPCRPAKGVPSERLVKVIHFT